MRLLTAIGDTSLVELARLRPAGGAAILAALGGRDAPAPPSIFSRSE
jgi:hypothetical protein